MDNTLSAREMRLRAALPLFIGLVVACGGLVLVHALAGLRHTPHPLSWLLFALLAIATGLFSISITSAKATISVSDTFFITSALLFGPSPVTIALALDSFIVSWRKKHPWRRIAFNTSAPALSMWLAARAFFWIGPHTPVSAAQSPIGGLLLPLLLLTLIYFLVNSGLTAIAIGLGSGQSPVDVWRHHFLWLSLGYFASASLALCQTVIIQQVGLVAVAVILPVLVVFQLTMRATFGRLDDAQRHISQIDRLYTSTIQTLAMAIDAKD